MQVIYGALCLPDLLFHSASTHFTEHKQTVLIIGFKSLLELPGIKRFIVAYIGGVILAWAIHTLIHVEYAPFRLSSRLDLNAEDHYNQLIWFTV